MRKTYVVSAKRSAIGSFLGSLTTVKPVDLGATVVKALLEDGKVAPEHVDELLCGNVLSAGLGQNIGRQVALSCRNSGNSMLTFSKHGMWFRSSYSNGGCYVHSDRFQ